MKYIYVTFLDAIIKVLGCIGVILIAALMIWECINLLNRIFKFSKYILLYFRYKKYDEMYNPEGKVMVDKDGEILTLLSPEEVETALKNAINKIKREKALREKYGKKCEE